MLQLLNRLKIWQKLSFVIVAFMIPLGLTTYFLLEEKSIKIDLTQWEMYGDEYLRPLAGALHGVASHKTLMRRQLRGAEGTAAELQSVRARVDKEMAALLA